ncbi:predicted protein [Scheffersomyces stipitis CBS 6054]|uniref:Uncharacterized protein n=1 Tax=Scheffersomyces stipitis (strain ATCC 58785 / CBS 6054 / NBRC 10063 / NRRL Y-11545) TaxID=322104 RepID=A3LUT2_PICST|nr:predicted protein [Scheffersomyces stipitis CBS 6054]ABN66646.2 predicted protein [Scheffersomyces stipitis CBS 6054]KAG2731402.1 hypothetical protein G9P44_005818 [Scheffersomyces stipitis]
MTASLSSQSLVPPSLLTPQNCHESSRISAFLRLSRLASDDTIRQHLNEVKTPAGCDDYFASTIVPQWQARAQLITFCENYAADFRKKTASGIHVNHEEPQGGAAHDNLLPQTFNLRLDPYAEKSYNQKLEQQYAQCDYIDNWVSNQKNVESIIREQTSHVLNDKCYYNDWLAQFKKLDSVIKQS